MSSRIDKYRKQVSYSRGIRKAAAMVQLAQALMGVDHVAASDTAAKALVLARRMHGRLDKNDKRARDYRLVVADALFANAQCLIAEFRSKEALERLREALVLWEELEAWEKMMPGLMQLVQHLRNKGELDEALKQLHLAMEMCVQLSLPRHQAGLFAMSATIHVMRKNHEAAFADVNLALQYLPHVPAADKAELLAEIANVQHDAAHTADAIESIEQAIEIARGLNDKHLLLRLLYNHSAFRFILDPRSDYATPLREAISLASETGNRQHQALLHEMYGVRAMRSGMYDRAIKELSRAGEIYRDLDGRAETMRILGWLGQVHCDLGAQDSGRKHLLEALDLLLGMPHGEGWTAVYRIIMDNMPELIDLDATAAVFQAEAETVQADNPGARAQILLLLARAEELRGNLNAAASAYEECLQLFEGMSIPCKEANALLGLGRIAALRGNHTIARVRLLEALAQSELCHEWQTTRAVHAELAAVAERLGDFREALQHRKLLHQREREIILPQVNNSVDRLLVGENAGMLQHILDEKNRRMEELRTRLDEVAKGASLNQLRAEEDEKRERQIIAFIESDLLTGRTLNLPQANSALAAVEQALFEGNAPVVDPAAAIQTDTIESVKRRFPALSVTECRVCAAICDGLSNRETADAMHVSIRAVETYRYRVRKKLGLEQGQDLAGFLLSN